MKKNRVDEFIKDPKRALLKISAPIIVAMLVQTMYNIVDTAFVGRLGADSIAALTFAFPLFFVLMALSAGVGTGLRSVVSRFMGAKKKRSGENAAIHGLILSILLAVVLASSGQFILRKFFSLAGATPVVTQLATEYMSVIFIGVIFMFPAYSINSIFASQGDTKTPMKIQVTSLLLNIVLDPIFIYVLGYGVKGAAIATTISLFVGLVLYIYYLPRRSYLELQWKAFRFSKKILKDIVFIGAPASLMMLVFAAYMAFVNKLMAHFGTDYVAAFGISFRLESVAILPIVALSLGLLTLTGMFFGAKRYDLLEKTVYYCMKVAIGFAAIIGLIFFITPIPFLRIFTPDALLIGLSAAYLRVIVLTFPLMAISMTVSRTMQGMGFGMPGLIINGLRVFFVAIPLAYVFIFVLGYGYLSVGVAMIIGGVLANIVGLFWVRSKFKRLDGIHPTGHHNR